MIRNESYIGASTKQNRKVIGGYCGQNDSNSDSNKKYVSPYYHDSKKMKKNIKREG